jgi:hypothetical protein
MSVLPALVPLFAPTATLATTFQEANAYLTVETESWMSLKTVMMGITTMETDVLLLVNLKLTILVSMMLLRGLMSDIVTQV